MNFQSLREGILFPLLSLAIFFLGVFIYLYRKYRIPSLFFFVFTGFGLINSLSIYFALGTKLSLIGLSAFIVAIFYSLFLSFFILSLIRGLFEFEFLDRKNIWANFKRGLIFSGDVTVPLFILSTFVAFLAPVHLREFGIILSLCIVVLFIFVAVIANFLSLNYIDKNFNKVQEIYRSIFIKKDVFISKLAKGFKFQTAYWGIFCIFLFFVLAFIIYKFLGLNSFYFLKENHILIIPTGSSDLQSGKSSTDVEKITTLEKLVENQPNVSVKNFSYGDSDSKAFIFSGPLNSETIKTLLKDVVKEDKINIQKTSSFSNSFTVSNLATAFLFGIVLLSTYVLIRFKLKSFLIFLFNSMMSFALMMSIVIVFRIYLTQSFFLAACTFFAMIVMYHMCWFNLSSTAKNVEWFANVHDDVYKSLYLSLRHMIFLFIFVTFIALKEELITINLYMILAIVSVHFASSYIYYSLSTIFDKFVNKFLHNNRQPHNWNQPYKEMNLDSEDEELVRGINAK